MPPYQLQFYADGVIMSNTYTEYKSILDGHIILMYNKCDTLTRGKLWN